MGNQLLFKWWGHLHYQLNNINNSQKQFDIANLMQTFQKSSWSEANFSTSSWSKLLNKILRYYTQIVPDMCGKVCSNGGTTYIISVIIAKTNLT